MGMTRRFVKWMPERLRPRIELSINYA